MLRTLLSSNYVAYIQPGRGRLKHRRLSITKMRSASRMVESRCAITKLIRADLSALIASAPASQCVCAGKKSPRPGSAPTAGTGTSRQWPKHWHPHRLVRRVGEGDILKHEPSVVHRIQKRLGADVTGDRVSTSNQDETSKQVTGVAVTCCLAFPCTTTAVGGSAVDLER
jgi:hypothetical protein